MNIRHLVTKGFGEDYDIRKSIVYNGVPIVISSSRRASNEEVKEETVEFHKSYPPEINAIQSLDDGKVELLDSPIGSIIATKGNIRPLSQLYDFKVDGSSELSGAIPDGATFDLIFEDDYMKDFMCNVAQTLFPNINPNTGEKDIDPSKFYAPYIPLVTLTGCVPPQKEDELAYFNPEGTVTIAEFLDGLNSIKYGSNANNTRKKTIDNISNETDYFNEGYQMCLRGISSPFFNLYTREELLQPITRLELAYITVICWTRFIDKFNTLYGGAFYLGINFDWEAPADIISNYKDGFDYKVSKISMSDDYDVISLDIKDYRSDRSMTEYKDDLKKGVSAIPLPMYMSMLELGVLDLFHFEDDLLSPMKEVSRGEFCYFLSKLAKIFPTKYLNN